MSEPDSAFFKLQIERADLVRWLETRPQPTSDWSDWRSIGGQWYIGAGPKALDDATADEFSATISECDAQIHGYPSNRAAIGALLSYPEQPQYKRATYDSGTKTFLAGTIAYSENLNDFLVFLTIVRGSAAFLGPGGYGVAVVHNYVWGGESEQITQAALRLGPNATSAFLDEREQASAAGAFQSLVDVMLQDPQSAPPPPPYELDTLK